MTWGVYSVFRHPAYVGWFFWSIGTQLLLGNPLCFCLYGYASVRFFRDRIPFEEATLIKQYGAEYERYMAKTYVGIPFVKSASGGGKREAKDQ